MTRLLTLVIAALMLAGCGSGGGGGADPGTASPAPGTTPVTTFYASGRVHETGFVETGTTIRTGQWRVLFDQADGQKQWVGTYVADAIDGTRPWTEWNADGAVRVDQADR